MEPPIDASAAEENNGLAADFIREESTVLTAFILTAPPIAGWPHLMGKK
jgi:hypothetical protein